MHIFYWNNCWFTNVGEAFIDIGAMELLKKLIEKSNTHIPLVNISNMSAYYINKTVGDAWTHPLSMYDYFRGGVVVFSGMFISEYHIKENPAFFERLEHMCSKGMRIVFLNVGQDTYSKEEADLFMQRLEGIDVPIIVTRDNITYENLKGWRSKDKKILKGIDCAFWVKDVYNPKLSADARKEYDVVSYNRSPEPVEFSQWDREVVRAWHMQYSLTETKVRDNQLVSDTPYDYLTIYANANRVYTDLVHATCVALQYGIPVRFKPVDGRAAVINALENLQMDRNGFLHINEADLERQKERIVASISNEFTAFSI